MTTPADDTPNPAAEAAIRDYELFCLASLLVVLLVLADRGFGLWSLVPVLVGMLGLVRSGPLGVPFFLFALAYVLLDFRHVSHWSWAHHDPAGDFVLSIGALGYAAGQTRLQGLVRPMVPVDPRTRGKAAEPKSGRVPGQGEMAWLLLFLPFWAALAPLAWEELPDAWYDLGLVPRLWRLIALVWLLGMGLALVAAAGMLLTWQQRGRTVDEAAMYLQDTLWRETRREQSRLHRWRTWGRLRRERREERS